GRMAAVRRRQLARERSPVGRRASAEERAGCGRDLFFALRGSGTELLELLRAGVQLRVQDAERLREIVDGRFERADPRLGCRELLVGLTESRLQLCDETASLLGGRVV